MGNLRKLGPLLFCPASKFGRIVTLSRNISVAYTSKLPASSSSSSDLALDKDLTSPVVDSQPPVVSVVCIVVGSSSYTSLLPKGANAPQISGPSAPLAPPCIRDSPSPPQPQTRRMADMIKESALLEELGSPTTHISGAPFVFIPDDNIASAKEEFKEFIFARFPGDIPKMERIIGIVNAIWARTGPRIFVHNVGKSTFLLKVSSDQTRNMLLSRQAWMIAGCPMFVAPWSPEFNLEQPQLSTAVVPVEFRGVPYLLFNQQSLSRIATAVGKYLSLAPETERKENFEVAKVWVRVNLLTELPKKIISGFSNGRENEISVSYLWLPKKCEKCSKFGHDQHLCSDTFTAWRPVDQTNTIYREPKSRNRSRPSRSSRKEGAKQSSTSENQTVIEDQGMQNYTEIVEVGLADQNSIPTDDPRTNTDAEQDFSPQLDVFLALSKDLGSAANSEKAIVTLQTEVSLAKQIVTLDRNLGFSTVHVYHEEGVSSPALQRADGDAPEAPLFLVNNRKRLNSNTRHTSVKEWINVHRPLFGAYLETRIQPNNSRRISGALPVGWKFFANSDHHHSARIIVVWYPSVMVTIYKASAQAVTCGIFIQAENINFTVSFVYAFNQPEERQALWEELSIPNDTTPVSRFPWAVLGDFNQILRVDQHSNHLQTEVDVTGMEDFNLAIQEAELFEAQANGLTYSWWNNQDASPVSKKIDHALINHHWADKFPDALCEFLEPEQSDHAPCLFSMPSVQRRVTKPFKFFHHNMDHPEYLEKVRAGWNCENIQESLQFKLARSLKLLKGSLRRLNTRHYSGISIGVKDQAVTVASLQRQLLTNPYAETVVLEHLERKKWQMLSKAEEKFYRQKSRVQWHNLGDRDTTFYHRSVVQRITMNHIHFLRDATEHMIGTSDGIKTHAIDYFSDILGKTELQTSPISVEQLKDLMPFRCLCGLEMNPVKSEIFFGGYEEIEAAVLSDISGFKLGTFPTRYLGLPLKPGKRLLLVFEAVFKLKRVWNFFTVSGSLWVAWLNNHHFRRLGFWLTQDSTRFSATIRSILELRPILKDFMHCVVGNGETASFWFDSWTSLGPLIDIAGQGGPRAMCLNKGAKVIDATRQGSWFMPPVRTDALHGIQVEITNFRPPLPSAGSDVHQWRRADGSFGSSFSSKIQRKQPRLYRSNYPCMHMSCV
ncbi:hypothetical protein Bca52824_036127 [Brassica carinata]|uniref:DUF4283 domain-containing protein n=1 Tax=Brassica carinata TaxID=52824 RepID=A0A8X7V1B0_BRACI|nr:hypothetical protein Bca52824_036127 [Brassica carinata]